MFTTCETFNFFEQAVVHPKLLQVMNTSSGRVVECFAWCSRGVIGSVPLHFAPKNPSRKQSPRYTVAESPRHTLAQALRDRHLLFLGNLLQLSTNASSSSSSSSSTSRTDDVRVGGPNVTGACPYPALRLD